MSSHDRGEGEPGEPSIEWTARALADLIAISDYIAADDPDAAARWTSRLVARAELAARLPLAGRLVPERKSLGVREVFLRTYRIVYRVRENGVLILTVFEGHRSFPPEIDENE